MDYDFTFAHRQEGFDEHINKSIRGYSELLNDVIAYSQYFVDSGTNVVDIGCSTGTNLIKILKNMGEKCKVSIRNIRREANEDLKKLLKSKDIGEDDEKTHEKKVQTITDNHIKSVEEKVLLKEKEIMTI